MAQSDPITDLVLQFLDASVDSIQQLEILRILGENHERQWKASDLANASQTKPSMIVGQLAALESRGLIKTEMVDGELGCRYAPRTPEIADLLEQLLRAYNERPVTLIKAVYERAQYRLNAFSEAFRLKKEREG